VTAPPPVSDLFEGAHLPWQPAVLPPPSPQLIFSTIMLIAAILMTDNFLGTQCGEGMFFKP
jgi:hypothetical protein